MSGKKDRGSYSEADLTVEHPKDHAAGPTAVAVSMKRALAQMGPKRTAQTLLKLNQAEGFDCMSCAWPDPEVGHRHLAEFCENGAKAVAEEATKARATPDFFATHSIAELDRQSEYWLGQQGRITHPMIKRPGATHYRPIDWDEAFEADRDRAEPARQSRRGDLLHIGPGVERGGLRVPAVRPRVRHQQHARLLQHVPRVDQHRPAGIDRHRQGQRQHRGRLPGEADHPGRPEPRHQPSAHAVGAGDRQEERRQDRLDQSADGGRAGQIQEPAGAEGLGGQGNGAVRLSPADQAERRSGVVPGARIAAGAMGLPGPRFHRQVHHRFRELAVACRGGRLGSGHRHHRAVAGTDHHPRARCSATPTRPCSAGRWG